ncbi:MAG: hypothetical protein ACJ78Q_17795 [Chloroflexia bacterium]
MSKFVLLYSGGGMPATEAEQAAVLKAWQEWFSDLGSDVVDGGEPFTGQAKTIDRSGMVTDGPAGTMASGYSIINADSLESAVQMAKRCPVLMGPDAKITVYETFHVM